jgi:hypothetical protein
MLLARTDKVIAKLMKNHAFDIATSRYIEVDTRRALNEKAFSNKFRHLTGESTPHSRVISHCFTRKVDRADYLPGVTELFTANENAESVVNLWRPGPVQPMAGDCSVITSHLAFVHPIIQKEQQPFGMLEDLKSWSNFKSIEEYSDVGDLPRVLRLILQRDRS